MNEYYGMRLERKKEKPMPKTKDNPLGINVLLCPICLDFSFFARNRSDAVKHFWECFHKRQNIDSVEQENKI